jgi:hypothetical protein
MDNGDLKTKLASLGLNPEEEKLVKNATTYGTNIPFILILILGICYIWFKHFNLFRQNIFFMVYNAIIHLGIIWAAVWAYSYQKKVNHLLAKLITIINNKK